jgi:hypothetical protein
MVGEVLQPMQLLLLIMAGDCLGGSWMAWLPGAAGVADNNVASCFLTLSPPPPVHEEIGG